jgi:hypothetical protein
MRRDWWRVVAGALITIVGAVVLLSQLGVIVLRGELWGALALLAGAVVFCALWLSNTREWWPLIPGLIMGGWGVAALFDIVGLPAWLSALIGFLGSSAPFFYIFLRLGAQAGWWALIPGGVLASWGLASVLGSLGLPDAMVALVGFAGSALPFLYVFYLDRKKNWWALIPGGVMTFMGVVTALGQAVGEEWTDTFILWGIAVVFLAVFAVDRRNRWALIPAGVLAVVGVSVGPVGRSLWVIGPLALILFGLVVVVRTVLWQNRA